MERGRSISASATRAIQNLLRGACRAALLAAVLVSCVSPFAAESLRYNSTFEFSAGDGSPQRGACDGTTAIYLPTKDANKLLRYTLATGERDALTLSRANPQAVALEGSFAYVSLHNPPAVLKIDKSGAAAPG